MKFLSPTGSDKYYKMNDEKLEKEAQKFKIQHYGDPDTGKIIREKIISQLIEKDNANNSKYAILVSIVAVVISIVSLIIAIILK